MKNHRRMLPLLAALGIALGVAGCDNKISQCNRLIETVNKHNEKIQAASTKMANIANDATAADDFVKVVTEAKDEIAKLEFKDEKISGFATEYGELLANAEKTGTALSEAAKSQDEAKYNEASKDSDALVTKENEIVNNLNAYCSAQ